MAARRKTAAPGAAPAPSADAKPADATSADGTSAGPKPDGRMLRTQRTKAALLDAAADAILAGEIAPTAEAIADRAGVSVRTVFVHFNGVDALLVETFQRVMMAKLGSRPQLSSEGPLEDRVAALVASRVEMFERSMPAWRAANALIERNPGFVSIVRRIRDLARAQAGYVFARELDGRDAATREGILVGIHVLGASSTWDMLRRFHGMSVEDAAAALRFGMLRLLAPAS